MRSLPLILAVLTTLPLLACETRYLGEGCLQDAEVCDSDLECREDYPEGFCTKSCERRGAEAGCPLDSLCIEQFGERICSPVCTSDQQCREGYECRGERGLSVRACRVKEQQGGMSQQPTE